LALLRKDQHGLAELALPIGKKGMAFVLNRLSWAGKCNKCMVKQQCLITWQQGINQPYEITWRLSLLQNGDFRSKSRHAKNFTTGI